MTAYTVLGFDRETSTPTRPRNSAGVSPSLAAFQVLPPSVVFQMPPSLLPGSTRGSLHLRRARCHMPTYSVFGSLGSITRSTAPVVGLREKAFVQFLPPSVVMNTPRISLSVHSWPEAAT